MSPSPRGRQRARQRIRASASYAGLKQIFDASERFATRHALSDAVRHDVYVAIEELVSNVMRHGPGHGLRPRVTVSLALGSDACRVVVADNGPPFNPLTIPAPDINQPLSDRPAGGLGILFVTKLMDGARYRRMAGCNHMMLTRKLTRQG